MEEVNQDQVDETAIRAEIAGRLYSQDGGSEVAPPTVPEEKPEAVKQDEPVDPWAGVPAAVRDQLTAMQLKLKEADAYQERLKQAERRIGSLQNELHAAAKAAAEMKKAPTPAEVEQAAKSLKEWDELKEEFPDWGKALDSKFAAERAELIASLKTETADAAALRAELEGKTGQTEEKLLSKLAATERKLEMTRLKLNHPDFDKVIASKEYGEWLATQPEIIRTTAATSNDADEASSILNNFKATSQYSEWAAKNLTPQTQTKTPEEIAAARQQRLERSQSFQGRTIPPQMSEADMTEAELRQKAAKRLWPKGT